MQPRTTSHARRAATCVIPMALALAGFSTQASAEAPPEPDGVASASDTISFADPVDDRLEALRLGCEARNTDRGAAVACRWSVPTAPSVSSVRLLRIEVGAGEPRETVHRTANLADNEFVDTLVRRGRRYAYAVQALNAAGHVVGTSRTEVVAVPKLDNTDVEVLRLECASVVSDEQRPHVLCEWSNPTVPGARAVTLWRSIDGGARERVASSGAPFETSYRDVVPAGTSRAVYAVIATDGHHQIVARSRASAVAFDQPRPDEVDQARTTRVARRSGQEAQD